MPSPLVPRRGSGSRDAFPLLLLLPWLLLPGVLVAATTVTVTYAPPLVYEMEPPADPTLEGAVPTTFTGSTDLELLSADSEVYRLAPNRWRAYIRWDAPLPWHAVFLGAAGDTVALAVTPKPSTPYAPGLHQVPVVELQTAPASLWDPATGIYCWGDSVNFLQRGEEWERPGTVTVRAADGTILLDDEPVGLRIHGATSRYYAQKGWRLYFDGYGTTDRVVLDLLGGTPEEFSRLILRMARYPEFLLRDNFANSLFLDLGHPGSRSRLVAVYLNGEAWGVYNLRDRFDSRWAEVTIGLPTGGYALVKDSETVAGDGGDWFDLLRWAARPADYTTAAWYDTLATRLDLDSWIDWLLVNVLLATADNGYVNNEVQLREGNGPWQMLMWDEDDVMLPENVGADLLRFYTSANAEQFAATRPPIWYMGGWTEQAQLRFDLLRHAMQNQTFRDRLDQRWQDLLTGPFSAPALHARLDSLVQAHTPEIPWQADRWSWPADWYADFAADLHDFLDQRLPVVQAQTADFLATFTEPVALSDLHAVLHGDTVTVTWRTEHESGLLGFVVERAEDTPTRFQEVATYREDPALAGHNTNQPVVYTWDDVAPPGDGPLFYRLRHEDEAGEQTVHVWYATVPRRPLPPLLVNELLAANDTVLADEFGEFDDWVELYNSGPDPVSTAGLYLSDDRGWPLRWALPDTSIPSHGHLLIWCDDDPEQGPWHAPFKLSAGGESAVLTLDDGRTVDAVDFGPQQADVSYGRDGDGGATWVFFITPTPGAPNGTVTTVPGGAAPRSLRAWPNPSAGSVLFGLPLTADPTVAPATGPVELRVYDLAGRLVRRLPATAAATGLIWDRRDASGRRVPAGTYLARLLVAGRPVARGRVVLVR